MYVKTKAIVISSLRYQDKSLIVKCFTESDGLKSYYVRDAFSSKKTNQKTVYFQPLNILNIEANHRNNGRLEYFKEVKIACPYFTIHTDITKTTLSIFISEILHNSIKEEGQNKNLYSYLETALQWLDTHNEIANFHLILLLGITRFLGFYPENPSEQNKHFDMAEGIFVPYESVNCLTENETRLLRKLLLLQFDNKSKTFHISERQLLLKILINYYSFHQEGFIKPKSIEILREVFN